MSHYIEIANTSTTTTVHNLRLKINEVIGVVNQIGEDVHLAAGNSYLTSTYVSNTTFQAFVANTNAYIAATSGTGEVSNVSFQSFIANTNLAITNLILQNVLGTPQGLSNLTQNGVLVASNTSALSFATGTVGEVLQINSSGVPVFDDLDGGTYS